MSAPRKEVLAEGVVAIYALCESDGRVRYVGKTHYKPARRLVYHVHASKHSRLPVGRWIRKRSEVGFRPLIKVIELATAEDWADRERFWISFYRSLEPDLLNLTDGGEGLAGHVQSPVHRARNAASHRTGRIFCCEACDRPFYRKQRDIDRGDTRFCSRSCYGVFQRGVHRPFAPKINEAGRAASAALRRAQTHCKRGHLLSGTNLFTTSAGSRGCRECRKLHKAKYRERAHGLA